MRLCVAKGRFASVFRDDAVSEARSVWNRDPASGNLRRRARGGIAGLREAQFPGQPYLRSPNREIMAQDPQAQAIRKRKATQKIARLKAEKMEAAEKQTKKNEKNA